VATRTRRTSRTAASTATAVRVVNLIPKSLSYESEQDSEPNLAVNPAQPTQMAASAFTPNPLGGESAPIFLSGDGGRTWRLNASVPSRGETQDITLAFSGRGGTLYAGILSRPPGTRGETRLRILRTSDYRSPAAMTVLRTRLGPDQPFVQAVTIGGRDRVYVGTNDTAVDSRTATVEVALSAGTRKAFRSARIETRATDGQDGPQVRPACHPDGTVYVGYAAWRGERGDFDANTLVISADIVLVRDDKGGAGTRPFRALVDPSDRRAGRLVATDVSFPFHSSGEGVPGQQRLGGDLTLAVDPRSSRRVYLAWADLQGDVYTTHLRRSEDGGATWSPDLRVIAHATNASLAVNRKGHVALLYQALEGNAARWVTHLERTTDGSTWSDLVLAQAPADDPPAQFDPYLGDYAHVLAVGSTFYGIFSASNAPYLEHFPSGVTYQRRVDFANHRLLATDGSVVPTSIDPFFFRVAD